MQKSNLKLLDAIPGRISDTEVLTLLKSQEINWKYLVIVKEFTRLKDDLLSDWLNISVKTFRSYKKEDTELKENIKEQVVLLLSLYKHGVEVFGSQDDFYQWLNTENYFLDRDRPINYLKTVTGIRFIENRITGIEYGDNV